MTANCAPTYDAIAHRCSHIRNSPPFITGAQAAESNDRIEVERAGTCQSRVPVPALFHDSLLRLEVAVNDSEALLESLGPFEVVGEGPQKITAHVGAFFHRVPDFGDIPAQEADPALVIDLAVGARPFAVRTSVLGDVDRQPGEV